MKSIWKGSISFGLVNIPINVYSAIAEHKFGFKTLCGKCHSPLKYIRWCERCKKEVTWDDTVKGFKQSKSSFFVITKEAIDKLKPEKMDTIDIKEFVDQSEIETLYIENHYYIMPSKTTDKAFFLFLAALKKSNKVAIGQFVMHEKEHVVAISSYKNMLLLNTLHYEYEIRSVDLHHAKVSVTKEELSLALQLINKLTHKKFTLSNYKDTFVEKLKKALKKGAKGKVIKPPKEKTTKEKSSIAESLKASLKHEARA